MNEVLETVKTSARKVLIRDLGSGFRDFTERRVAWSADEEFGRVRRNTLEHACPVIFLFLLYSVRRIPKSPAARTKLDLPRSRGVICSVCDTREKARKTIASTTRYFPREIAS